MPGGGSRPGEDVGIDADGADTEFRRHAGHRQQRIEAVVARRRRQNLRTDAAGAAVLPELAIGVLHRLDAAFHIEHRLDIVIRQQQHQAVTCLLPGSGHVPEPAKLGHVATSLDGAACSHELVGALRPERARHQVERLGFDLVARHRIVGRAPDRDRAMRQPASVPQSDLNDGLPPRARLHQLLAGDQLDLLPARRERPDPVMRPWSCTEWNVSRPSTSSSAMRCCTLTSGIGALSTVRAERVGR